ncbi:MAG: Eco57I restriction-modification methylase domain-containing protein, partial [Pseudonocardiaceae bacterium]
RHRFLHWPLAFPHVFSRENPGFDAVVGNPPWEEVTVEALAFYGLFRPRLRSLAERPRSQAIAELIAERPDLPDRLAEAQASSAAQRQYFGAGEYTSMSGDPDLYKFFCQRYRVVLRDGGVLGVVLPRSTFVNDGSEGFRRWLFEDNTCRRCDFLLNTGRWAFDSEPRYTVALVAAERRVPAEDHEVRVAGTAASLSAWEQQTMSPGIRLRREAFGPGWSTPLLKGQREADLLAKLRVGKPFARGAADRWRCFPVRELDETNDRHFWQDATSGKPLWKGESFEQYDPHGAEARVCPDTQDVRKKVNKPRPGAGSLAAAEFTLAARRQAVIEEVARTRVAFRDVSRATDSRTVRACLVPPGIYLTNTAPYLVFAAGDDKARAACVGIMNSLPFDWQTRRFVELHLNFFILEGLVVPDLTDEGFAVVADCAARLSCVDQRFLDLGVAFGIEPGPLPDEERRRLRVEIDAQVAHALQLTIDDLDVLLTDFSVDAVPAGHRRQLRERLMELSGR